MLPERVIRFLGLVIFARNTHVHLADAEGKKLLAIWFGEPGNSLLLLDGEARCGDEWRTRRSAQTEGAGKKETFSEKSHRSIAWSAYHRSDIAAEPNISANS